MRAALLSPARWSAFRLSKHFVAQALAARGDVLYVDPPVSVGSLVRAPARLTDLLTRRVETDPSGVRVWRPLVVPGQNTTAGQAINGRLVARGVQRRLGAPDLVVAFSLEARGVLPRLPGRRIYYCTDSFEDLPGVDAAAVQRWERELTDAADAVVACSKPLVEQLRSRGVAAVYLPHGCDDAAFAGDPLDPPELADRPRPWVGCVGSLNFRIDPAHLEAAVEATGGGTLAVVGGPFGPPPDSRLGAVLARPDVVSLPHQDAGRLPRVIAALDVGLVPYADHPFNRKSFPIKILQYLAAGVPVVSTPNGATDELPEVVLVAGDASDFGAAVRAALALSSPAERAARVAVARARTWDRVADRLVAAAGVT